ncbi:MAG: hypothetical protein LBV54_08500, partial [Puniceicoccales bacterium]|nr:hypothetical protein [Puniceicoccales bacterium]
MPQEHKVNVWFFVGFSGHRNIQNEPLLRSSIAEALKQIAAATHSPIAAVSSAAKGADTLFVETVFAQSPAIPWIALLPFSRERFFNPDDFTDADRDRIQPRLEQAARVIEAATETSEENTDKENRTQAFVSCTLRTVDECDVLLAIWDGTPGRPGGTGDAVSYAKEQGKPVVWIHSQTGEIKTENPERLARVSDTLAVFAAPVELSRGQTVEERKAIITELREKLSKQASLNQPRFQSGTLILIGLHQFSIAVAISSLLWGNHTWGFAALLIEFFALSAALLFPLFFQRTHEAWINNRLGSELCRSMLAVWEFKGADVIFPAIRLPIFENFQHSIFLWRVAYSPVSGQGQTPEEHLQRVKQDYSEKRIEDQLKYFRRNSTKAERKEKIFRRTARTCTALAILGVCLFLYFNISGGHPAFYGVLKLVTLSLPLVSATFLSAIGAIDAGRRAARYKAMSEFLERAKSHFWRQTTWQELREVAIEIEKTLLLEVWEWNSVARYS